MGNLPGYCGVSACSETDAFTVSHTSPRLTLCEEHAARWAEPLELVRHRCAACKRDPQFTAPEAKCPRCDTGPGGRRLPLPPFEGFGSAQLERPAPPAPGQQLPTRLAVAATPRERLFLTVVLFQRDTAGVPLLNISTMADSVGFRALLNDLRLQPIRAALRLYGGVNFKTSESRDVWLHWVSREAIVFVRERLSRLPRSADQEEEMGALLEGLHGFDIEKWGCRPDLVRQGFVPARLPWYNQGRERWEPAKADGFMRFGGMTIPGAAFQNCVDALETQIEKLPPVVQRQAFVAELEKFFRDVADVAEASPAAPPGGDDVQAAEPLSSGAIADRAFSKAASVEE